MSETPLSSTSLFRVRLPLMVSCEVMTVGAPPGLPGYEGEQVFGGALLKWHVLTSGRNERGDVRGAGVDLFALGLHRDYLARFANLHINVHRGDLRDCRDKVVDDCILQARRADGHLVGPGDNLGATKAPAESVPAGVDGHARILVDDDDAGVRHESTAGIENLAANGRVRILTLRHASV